MAHESQTNRSEGNAGRLAEFLDRLKSQGISQREVAARVKVPAQYLSDVKGASRSFTELFARRLAEEFGVHYLWFLGRSDSMQPPSIGAGKTFGGTASVMLPVFPQPIEGEPAEHGAWDGTTIEIVGAAVAKSRSAIRPYILRIGADDRRGRLRTNDLVLVSQAIDLDVEIQLVKSGRKTLLARSVSSTEWEPLVPRKAFLTNAASIGHVLGIVWGATA